MYEVFFIMITTWIGFDATLEDIPVQYHPGSTFESRTACEDSLKNIFASQKNFRLETIRTTRNEIVLRVVSGTNKYNTFVTCAEIEKRK